jgi:hypothetical protein
VEIFISWSGERSKLAAKALRDWLRSVHQAVRPWMSERDIPAGSQWRTEIGSRLAQAGFGIICLTAENQHKPWLLFEAGALAKEMGDFVCPYLIDLEKSDVEEPLAQFQAKKANEVETSELIQSVNQRLLAVAPDKALSSDDLARSFVRWWPDLQEALLNLPPSGQNVQRRGVPEMLEEVLELSRSMSRQLSSPAGRFESFDLPEIVHPSDVIEEGAEKKFRDFVREQRAALAGFMEQGAKITKMGNALYVVPKSPIYNRYLRDNGAEIQRLAQEFFGLNVRVSVITVEKKK